jgi:hypothetical protein
MLGLGINPPKLTYQDINQFHFIRSGMFEGVEKWGEDDLNKSIKTLEEFFKELGNEFSRQYATKTYGEALLNLNKHYLPDLAGEMFTNASDSIVLRASKFPDPNYRGEIYLGINVRSGILQVHIEDNGLGINPFVEAKLFTRNPEEGIPDQSYRTKREIREKDKKILICGQKGSGLAQLKDFMTLVRGKCDYRNKGHLKGASFWYSVPLTSIASPLEDMR